MTLPAESASRSGGMWFRQSRTRNVQIDPTCVEDQVRVEITAAGLRY
jgi:hypothetical protein